MSQVWERCICGAEFGLDHGSSYGANAVLEELGKWRKDHSCDKRPTLASGSVGTVKESDPAAYRSKSFRCETCQREATDRELRGITDYMLPAGWVMLRVGTATDVVGTLRFCSSRCAETSNVFKSWLYSSSSLAR